MQPSHEQRFRCRDDGEVGSPTSALRPFSEALSWSPSAGGDAAKRPSSSASATGGVIGGAHLLFARCAGKAAAQIPFSIAAAPFFYTSLAGGEVPATSFGFTSAAEEGVTELFPVTFGAGDGVAEIPLSIPSITGVSVDENPLSIPSVVEDVVAALKITSTSGGLMAEVPLSVSSGSGGGVTRNPPSVTVSPGRLITEAPISVTASVSGEVTEDPPSLTASAGVATIKNPPSFTSGADASVAEETTLAVTSAVDGEVTENPLSFTSASKGDVEDPLSFSPGTRGRITAASSPGDGDVTEHPLSFTSGGVVVPGPELRRGLSLHNAVRAPPVKSGEVKEIPLTFGDTQSDSNRK